MAETLDELFILSTSPPSIWCLFRSLCSGKNCHVQAASSNRTSAQNLRCFAFNDKAKRNVCICSLALMAVLCRVYAAFYTLNTLYVCVRPLLVTLSILLFLCCFPPGCVLLSFSGNVFHNACILVCQFDIYFCCLFSSLISFLGFVLKSDFFGP